MQQNPDWIVDKCMSQIKFVEELRTEMGITMCPIFETKQKTKLFLRGHRGTSSHHKNTVGNLDYT